MENYSLKIIEGNVAIENPFPSFRSSKHKTYYLPGKFKGTDVSVPITDDDLTKGLLFLGSAGQGKTNTMLALASQILENLSEDDLVVFFDLKGDYRNTFFDSSDFVLKATDDRYVWNVFDELISFLGNEYMLEMRIKELCQYLYKGRESKEPYFTNAAREVTECIFKYFLYSASESGDYSNLNNKSFKNFVKGYGYNYDDTYEQIRDLLMTYDEFKSALSYIPPREENDKSAYAVISEISSMVNDVFSAAFGVSDFNGGEYISASKFAHGDGAQVIYLAYNPAISKSQAYAFRYFVDNIIANRCDYFYIDEDILNGTPKKRVQSKKIGKTYIFLDEFAQLPKLEYLTLALGQLRSLGVCIIGGLQEIEQIKSVYIEHEANTILSGFQSIISFNCDDESIKYVQKKTGSAKVQDKFRQAGGSLSYSPPYERKSILDRDVLSLVQGEAFVKIVGYDPFKFKFSENRIEGG